MEIANEAANKLIDRIDPRIRDGLREIKDIGFSKLPAAGPMTKKPGVPAPMSVKPNQPDPTNKKPSFGKRLWETVKSGAKAIAPSLLKIADNFTGGATSKIY